MLLPILPVELGSPLLAESSQVSAAQCELAPCGISGIPAEFHVEARLHDVDIGSKVARKGPDRTGEPAAEAAVVVVAKAVVIVFNEPGHQSRNAYSPPTPTVQ